MLARLLLAALPLLAAYLFHRLRYIRFRQYARFRQAKSSLIWGHMKVLHEFILRGKPDRHIGASAFVANNLERVVAGEASYNRVLLEMSNELGNPSVFVVDLRPVGHPMAVITSHDVAEQVSRATKLFPWSTPKSPTMGSLVHLIGPRSILTREDDDWKRLRKRFNPGFAPQHLMTLLPCILDKTWLFLRHLDGYARTGEEFPLDKLATNLTFDIIGAVVMDVNFDAQHLDKARQGEFIRLYSELITTYTNDDGQLPSWLQPRRAWRRHRLSTQIDDLLKHMIRRKYAEQRASPSAKRSRSILTLSLQDTDQLTESLVEDTCDQLKTFLFAGHDTTSILLAWMFYELSRTPRALRTVRSELDDIFGHDPDPAVVRNRLLSEEGEDLVRRMSYSSAVIKEILRLHPPAGTARMSRPGTGFVVRPSQGEDVCLDGLVIYNCASIIQRDKAVFGESANDFVPERWLGDSDTSQATNAGSEPPSGTLAEKDGHSIPAGAWRPFERGPRNCIGQELANIEARVILAVVARRYDFAKVGLGELVFNDEGLPLLNEKGQYKVKSELYNTRQVTAKPVDGTRMKVKLTPASSLNLR
ncbi:putative sterigmatocystin biosynthesis P450 monooxygenase stcS [Diplogelasinospora grovesii]|uniref:Sterigmatocystin biosynthesis P450 monooxygenase stcS n=1 Tax=Diplogelasinospora grovesii TaxID=303347 RepID=A0AAN6N598_9PEZI|nr:putative sterigmatocystin biosynthesis P450 monooxygenase stcS [Diplogelasinospora grovesii]